VAVEREVRRSTDLAAPPARVWPALADPALVAVWLDADVSGPWRPGGWGLLRERGGAERVAVVDEVDEAAGRVVLRWWPAAGGEGSAVTISLEPRECGSRVEVVERPLPAVAAGAGPASAGAALTSSTAP
jgi:uncharacterized protein YndB with AHSA1/START domain